MSILDDVKVNNHNILKKVNQIMDSPTEIENHYRNDLFTEDPNVFLPNQYNQSNIIIYL